VGFGAPPRNGNRRGGDWFQQQLEESGSAPRPRLNRGEPSALAGKLFDESGDQADLRFLRIQQTQPPNCPGESAWRQACETTSRSVGSDGALLEKRLEPRNDLKKRVALVDQLPGRRSLAPPR